MKNTNQNPEGTDEDSPELGKEFWSRAQPAGAFFTSLWGNEKTEDFLNEQQRRRGQRGKQKTPTKVRVSLRLPADVVTHFRATGKGWQTRIDQALQEWMRTHPLT
jgi:uncharacterized protein (DUF4415 family)